MTDQSYALTNLYHPTGAKVSIPLSLTEQLTTEHATRLLYAVDALIAAGFNVNLPGLEDGENYEQIGFAVRREKANDDGSATPIVDVYPVNGNFRILGIYLNASDDVTAFETATGLRIASMPLYDGAPIERGKNPRLDKNVVSLKSPAKLVWKLNPKWEGNDDKKHSKRVFVRWDGLRPAEQPAMTLEDARKITTAKGTEFGTLTLDQLNQVIALNDITENQCTAANLLINFLKGN